MVTKLSSKKFSQKNFWKYLNLLELLLSQNSKVTDAVTILCNDSDKMIQKASIEIQNNLQKGLSVSQALSKVFVLPNAKTLSIFKAGEESAALEKALRALTVEQKKLEERNKRLTDLLVYPSICLLYTSPSPRDATLSRMPSSA